MSIVSVFMGMTIANLLVVILVIAIYLSKPRIASLENRLYKIMLIGVFIGLILEFGCHLIVSGNDGLLSSLPALEDIILKLYVVYIAFFGACFNMYVATTALKKKYQKPILYITIAIFVAVLVMAFAAPIHRYYNGNIGYTYGVGVDFGLIPMSLLYLAFWTFVCIKNFRGLKQKKFLPIGLIVALLIVACTLQISNRGMLIVIATHVLTMVLMLYTVENPDRKQLELMTKLKDAETQANKAKSTFLSIASHQLRTPLTSIKGYSSMLAGGDFGKLTDQQSRVAKEIFSSSERMSFLISDLLNASRVEAGKLSISPTDSDMEKLVKREIDRLQHLANSHSVELKFVVLNELPQVAIDSDKICEVVANMIDNAIFYSPASSVVEISLKEDNGYLEFRVQDSGIGVPEHEQPHLFSKFYRASNAQAVRPDGTGIGLFLAKKVVEQQSGEIIFHSVQDKGSTFGFRFPINKPEPGSESESKPESE